MRFWVSWSESGADYQPQNSPPNAAILGWLHSGYDTSNRVVLCALVEAVSKPMAELAIQIEWPQANVRGWRRFDIVPDSREIPAEDQTCK